MIQGIWQIDNGASRFPAPDKKRDPRDCDKLKQKPSACLCRGHADGFVEALPGSIIESAVKEIIIVQVVVEIHFK